MVTTLFNGVAKGDGGGGGTGVPESPLSHSSSTLPFIKRHSTDSLWARIVGGVVGYWLVRWTRDRAVRVRALAEALRCVFG